MDGRGAGAFRGPGRVRRALDRVTGRLAPAGTGTPPAPGGADVGALERRLAHVEQELQGLQDSVHREARRRDDEIADLRRQLRPDEIARSMSDDARRRGI